MTKREIKQNYLLRLKEISQGFKAQKKAVKDDYDADIQKYYAQKNKPNVINPPKRSVLEEVGNAVTHGVGALFAVVAYIAMLYFSKTTLNIVAATVYFAGLFILFTMSCLYHSFRHGSAVKRLFRRFDYSSIYLLIGATFAPILLCYVGGTFGITFFVVQWLIIAAGITFIGVFGPTKLKKLHILLYLLLGWSGLLFIPQMLANNVGLFWFILGGGIIYSLGIIPYALKKKSSHFIWHFFVLAGAAVQWAGIFMFLYM